MTRLPHPLGLLLRLLTTVEERKVGRKEGRERGRTEGREEGSNKRSLEREGGEIENGSCGVRMKRKKEAVFNGTIIEFLAVGRVKK